MALTDDYNVSAQGYEDVFDTQNRTEDKVIVDTGEQFDRDNLLHFIEDKFKTNVKGGVTLFNLRAIFHTLIKSVPNIKDNIFGKKTIPVVNFGGRVYSGAANRYYYGNSTFGLNHTTWSSYVSNLAFGVPAASTAAGYNTSIDLKNVSIRGTIANTSHTGNVDIYVYTSDQDDGGMFIDNFDLFASATVNCAVQNDSYTFEINTTTTIPAGKIVYLLIKNTGYTGSGTKYLTFQAGLTATIFE